MALSLADPSTIQCLIPNTILKYKLANRQSLRRSTSRRTKQCSKSSLCLNLTLKLRSKAEKEVIQLKYKGNQKQFELNAQVESIFDSIQAEIPTPDHGARVQKLVKQGKKLIRKRQKLIKIADRNKDGWQVVEEYESDDLASGSDDEKRLKKAKDAVSRKRRQHDLPPKSSGKRPKIAVGDSDNQLFRGTYLANIAPVVLVILIWFGSA